MPAPKPVTELADSTRKALASNPATLPGRLAELAEIANLDLVIRLSENPNTPTGPLVSWSTYPLFDVRRRVAGHRNTPAVTLHAMASDEDWPTRFEVAGNRNASRDTMALLSQDGQVTVRMAAAEHGTDPDLLTRLAGDTERMVRLYTARNVRTPVGSLERLADDDLAAVRERARATLLDRAVGLLDGPGRAVAEQLVADGWARPHTELTETATQIARHPNT